MLTKGGKQLRAWLKNKRTELNLSQEDVADKSKIERQYYQMIESGRRNPSVKVAKRIAEALNFYWIIFFDDDVNETTHKEKVNS